MNNYKYLPLDDLIADQQACEIKIEELNKKIKSIRCRFCPCKDGNHYSVELEIYKAILPEINFFVDEGIVILQEFISEDVVKNILLEYLKTF